MRLLSVFLLIFFSRGTITGFNNCRQCECCKNSTVMCKDNGHEIKCLNGCIDGYYGSDCTNACFNDCLSCLDNITCTTCRAGFYGESCNKCPDKCLTCLSPENCTTCKDGFYNGRLIDSYGTYYNNCHFPCQHNCISCTSYHNCTKYGCTEGFADPDCTQCIDGKYGAKCDQNCSEKCVKCMNGMTCTKCNPRHWGDTCISCPQHCSNCNSSIHCLSCDHGYYGDVCDTKCPNNCYNGTCDRDNGTCISCIDGFYGIYCNATCPRHCVDNKCNRDNKTCISCIDGFYGIYCNATCPRHCVDNKCNFDGTCFSCKEGYYADNCTAVCPRNCKSCGFHTGYCQTCIGGFYGNECQKACLPGCKLCQKLDGYCTKCTAGFLNENIGICETRNDCDKNCKTCKNQYKVCTSCIDGKFGQLLGSKYPHCKLNCPVQCLNKTCDVKTGYCIMGCIAGYWGFYCTTPCPSKCSNEKCFWHNGTCIQGPNCACNCQCDSQGNCKPPITGLPLGNGQGECEYCPDNCKAQEDTVREKDSSVVIICVCVGAGSALMLTIGTVIIVLKRRNIGVEKKETDKARNIDGNKVTVSEIDERDAENTNTAQRKNRVQECVRTVKTGKSKASDAANSEIDTYGEEKVYENAEEWDYEEPTTDDSTMKITYEMPSDEKRKSRGSNYSSSGRDIYEKVNVYGNAEDIEYLELVSN